MTARLHGPPGPPPAPRGPVHGWTRVYWPAGLAASLAAFFVPCLTGWGSTGWGLLAGMGILGIPELACVLTRNFQDTFSDWFWAHTHITDSVGASPLRRWTAGHVLLAFAFVFVAANVVVYLASVAWQAALAGSLFLFWLLFHFYRHWWT